MLSCNHYQFMFPRKPSTSIGVSLTKDFKESPEDFFYNLTLLTRVEQRVGVRVNVWLILWSSCKTWIRFFLCEAILWVEFNKEKSIFDKVERTYSVLVNTVVLACLKLGYLFKKQYYTDKEFHITERKTIHYVEISCVTIFYPFKSLLLQGNLLAFNVLLTSSIRSYLL